MILSRLERGLLVSAKMRALRYSLTIFSEMPETWRLMEVLQWTAEHFAKKGFASARLDAELLISHALGVKRIELYMRPEMPLKDKERKAIRELVLKRLSGIPVAYLTGHKDFWAMTFQVSPAVLIPRPATEDLVEHAHINLLSRKGEPLKILDIGTGCACIACALAKEFPQAQIIATDISMDALEVARKNIELLGFSERISVRQGDLYKAVRGEERFDLIISNPPYIPSSLMETLASEVKQEPTIALDGGEDGLRIIRKIARGASQHLLDGGLLMVEIDNLHGEKIAKEVDTPGLEFKGIANDLAGLPRIGWWQKI